MDCGLLIREMSQTNINFFVLGVTGYIGGSVLDRLLRHPNAENFRFTALVRDSDKAEKLKSIGFNAVIGSQSDLSVLEDLSSKADVVFSMADSDDLKAIQALLRGSRTYYETTGGKQTFLHLSGTGVITDKAYGEYPADFVYSDLDIESIEALAPTQIHRDVDLTVVEADVQGYVNTYIVVPGYVFGKASGKLVDLGIQRDNNRFTHLLIQPALVRGAVGHIGAGKNVWAFVEVGETADLIVLIYNAIRSNPSTAHGREGFYFAENGEVSMHVMSKIIAGGLFAGGKIKHAEPTPFTEEELPNFFPPPIASALSGNSRCKADRGRRLGWKPVKTAEDAVESIRIQVRDILHTL